MSDSLRDCNTTIPEIQAAPSPWDVAVDVVLREYAALWRKLSPTHSRGSTEASVAEPILISGDKAVGYDFDDILSEAMEYKAFREYVEGLHDWRLCCMTSVSGWLRLFAATVLSWVAGWLSCAADYIGNPGMYERWRWVGPIEIWRSFRIEWAMWHEDET